MADFIFQDKEFSYPSRILNERVFEIMEYEEKTSRIWWTTREGVNTMMRLMLDGDHDSVDFSKITLDETMKVYNGFFPYCAKKIKESGE